MLVKVKDRPNSIDFILEELKTVILYLRKMEFAYNWSLIIESTQNRVKQKRIIYEYSKFSDTNSGSEYKNQKIQKTQNNFYLLSVSL